jgi:hypothetical protein
MLAAAQCLAPWYIEAAERWDSAGAWRPATLAGVYAWASVFGWAGAALACVKRRRALVTYFATKAYWIYVVHPPLVGAVQVALWGVAMPAWSKAALAVAAAVAAAALSYEPFLRLTRRFTPRSMRSAES